MKIINTKNSKSTSSEKIKVLAGHIQKGPMQIGNSKISETETSETVWKMFRTKLTEFSNCNLPFF